MPRFTEKQQLTKALEKTVCALDAIGDDETCYEALELLQFISSRRYLTDRTRLAKYRSFTRVELLEKLYKGDGRKYIRMNWTSFEHLYSLIHSNSTYHGKEPAEVKIQMILALERMGLSGPLAGSLARSIGASDETVYTYTKRLIVAVIETLSKDYLKWPQEDEKRRLETEIENRYGFPSCLGFIGCTLVHLVSKPEWNGQDFHTKNNNYAMKIMVVADHQSRIRMIHTSHIGITPDGKVFEESDLGQRLGQYFTCPEYILASDEYRSSVAVITEHKKTGRLVSLDEKKFNERHFAARVNVDRSMDQLKGRFQSLKKLKMDIRCRQDVSKAKMWIIACSILHNLLVELNDPISKEWCKQEEDKIVEIEQEQLDLEKATKSLSETRCGEEKRDILHSILKIKRFIK